MNNLCVETAVVSNDKSNLYCPSDISEYNIRSRVPYILDILLLDRTSSTPDNHKNIIWANDNYAKYDAIAYADTAQIKPELIIGRMGSLIMPRALKTKAMQKERTRAVAEVFTPIELVRKQNDILDNNYCSDDLYTYVRRKWLEIACGEAPYMVTRYNMGTGDIIPISERTGFVDRKLTRINKEISDRVEWQRLVELAYKSSYGFEWNGDSLLLARENLLFTYNDYYFSKWSDEPANELLKEIARIISYNIFQMDGLSFTIPLSSRVQVVSSMQLSIFDSDDIQEEWQVVPGHRVKIMNWDTGKMEFFGKEIKMI